MHYTLVSLEDLTEIRKYQDRLRAQNTLCKDILIKITNYERGKGSSYKHSLESLKSIARKGLKEFK